MRNPAPGVLMFGVPAFVARAAGYRGSLVIIFKDGHQQSFPPSEVAPLQFKTSPRTTAVGLPPEAFSVSAGHFLGRWRVGDGAGSSFIITLDRKGYATKTVGGRHGTWTVENGEAHISWDDGWHDAIRRAGNNYEKAAYGPGKNFSDPPDNVADAKSLDPI